MRAETKQIERAEAEKKTNRSMQANQFSGRAMDFLRALRAIEKQIDPEIPIEAAMPRLLLCGHAIELALKSYLLASGVPREKLKTKYGHRLQEAFSDAKAFGLPTDPEIEKMIRVLGPPFSERRMNYPEGGFGFLLPSDMLPALERLVEYSENFSLRETAKYFGEIMKADGKDWPPAECE